MSRSKKRLLAVFLLISVLFILLRLKTLNHLLMWDEAWNILSLRAFLGNAKADPFYWGYFFHPPLYMTLAVFLAPFDMSFNVRLELLSLLFSYGTLLVVYLFSARIGGLRYAVASGLFLCLMPISIGYDTWIKADGLASMFGYLALFLLFEKRFYWCAVMLFFALLAKENALLFILSATLLTFLLREKGTGKKLLVMYGIVGALTSWWFIRFSTLVESAHDIFFVYSKERVGWADSPLYHFRKLLPDLGVAVLFFLVIGICYILYLIIYKRQRRWATPVVMAGCVYILSLFFMIFKAPWHCLIARPALAMVAGGGALFLLRMSKKSKLASFILYPFLILAFFTGSSFSYSGYHMKTYPYGWPGAKSSNELAIYLNKHMQDNDRLMITDFAYWRTPVCPVFLYYWKTRPVEIVSGKEKCENILKEIVVNKISWLAVVDSPDPDYNFHPLVEALKISVLGKPASVGWAYVWRTESLWADQEESRGLKTTVILANSCS